MIIEKRHLKRIQEKFNAQLAYRGRTFSVKASNLSDGGMYLETNTLQIPQGMLVDLEFYHGGNNWRISGLIVHRNSQGFGIMFKNIQPEISSLKNLGIQSVSAQPEFTQLPVQG